MVRIIGYAFGAGLPSNVSSRGFFLGNGPMHAGRTNDNGIRWVYVGLSILFFLTAGAGINRFHAFEIRWAIAAFLCSFGALVFLALKTTVRTMVTQMNLWIVACIIYAAGIAATGIVHWCALDQVTAETSVNVAELTARRWTQQNIKFAAFYLLFPLCCVIQYLSLKRLSLQAVVRILASVLTVCLGAVLFFLAWPGSFGDNVIWRLNRFRGLFVSPNSLSLTAFLLMQWLVVGLTLRGRTVTKAWYGGLVLLLGAGMVMSGSRTGILTALFFMILVPLLFVDRLSDRKRRVLRLPALALPLVTLGALGFLMLSAGQGVRTDKGLMLQRSQEIVNRIESDGIVGVLFKNERRGLHALLAWTFMKRAPYAGWGPGGFYREHANVAYIYTGEVIPAKDSALNHYLMIGGDLGMPLLFLNLFIVVTPVLVGWRVSRNTRDSGDRTVVRTFALGNAVFLIGANFIPPSYFPDIVWIWSAHLALVVVLVEKQGRLIFRRSGTSCSLAGLLTIAVLALATMGSVVVAFGRWGYKGRQAADWWPWKYEHGCYPEERWKEGRGRWCCDEAVLQIPVTQPLPDTVLVEIAANHPDIPMDPVTVRYGGVSGPSERVIVDGFGWKTLAIPVTKEYLYEPTASAERQRWILPMIPGTERFLTPDGRREDRYFVLSFHVSRAWVPKEWGRREDTRELGVAVLLPDL